MQLSAEFLPLGDTATLKVGGVTKASHTFGAGVHGGGLGVHLRNAHTHFDDVWAKEVVSYRQYYSFNGQRVAMRKDGVLYYIVG
jgi:hypothetical protein